MTNHRIFTSHITYGSNYAPSQPFCISITPSVIVFYHLLAFQCLHPIGINQQSHLNIISLGNLKLHSSSLILQNFFCHFLFVSRQVLSDIRPKKSYSCFPILYFCNLKYLNCYSEFRSFTISSLMLFFFFLLNQCFLDNRSLAAIVQYSIKPIPPHPSFNKQILPSRGQYTWFSPQI